MTEPAKKNERGFMTAFDEFHELIVWTLLIGGGGLLFTETITRTDFLVVLGVAFAIMSGFKLRRFKIGSVEVEGDDK